MTKLVNSDIEALTRRRPVWNALADLFLDTELTEEHSLYIARIILESGYDRQEIENILYDEVVPVVGSNMLSIAGEWAGFDEKWLEAEILALPAKPSLLRRFLNWLFPDFRRDFYRKMIKEDWHSIMGSLKILKTLKILETQKEFAHKRKSK